MQEDCKEIFETCVKTTISFFCAIWLLLLVCALCGCSRTHYVPVESVRTESVRTDSAMFERILDFMRESVRRSQSTSDTTILKITNTYTLNENGDTVKSDTNTKEYRSTSREVELERIVAQVRDSNKMLQARLDLQKTDTISVPYPVEKKLTKWESVKMDFGGLMLGAVCALVVLSAVLGWMAIKKRRGA